MPALGRLVISEVVVIGLVAAHLVAGDEVRQEDGLAVDTELLGPQGLDDRVDLGRAGTADANVGGRGLLSVTGKAFAVDCGDYSLLAQSEFTHGFNNHIHLAPQESHVDGIAVEAVKHDVGHDLPP